MKRFIALLLIVFTIAAATIVPICAAINWNSTQDCRISLTFSGSTANCSLDVYATDSNADITATIKLQKKGLLGIYTTKEKWEDVNGTGDLNFYDTYSPVDSGEYKLIADIDVVGDSGSDSFTMGLLSNKILL